MKKRCQRLMAGVLSALLLLGVSPLQAMAAERQAEDAQLREAIRGDVKWQAQFPNGLFNFIGTQINVHENDGSLELTVARQGGTQGEVSVELKLVDVTAEYGKDYTVRVGSVTQAKGENAVPLISTLEGGTVNISQGGETAPAEKAPSAYAVEKDTQPSVPALREGQAVIEDAPVPKAAAPSLRQAREAQLGVESGWQSWQELDREQLSALQDSYDQALDGMPGTVIPLTFAEGEYMKSIYVDLVDDDISETEEQFMLLLQAPAGGAACGEFKTAYVNIIDDEEPEASTFYFEKAEVTADGSLAQVTVARTGGLERYSSVTVGTSQGTARAESDYLSGLQELTFAPGVVSQRVAVTVKDNVFRGEERRFGLLLEPVGDSKVKAGQGTCEVVVPPVAEPMTVAAYNLAARNNANDDPVEIDKPSPHGACYEKGTWTLHQTGQDFLIAGPDDDGTTDVDYTLGSGEIKRAVRGCSSNKSLYIHTSDVPSPYGVDSISFDFSCSSTGFLPGVFPAVQKITFDGANSEDYFWIGNSAQEQHADYTLKSSEQWFAGNYGLTSNNLCGPGQLTFWDFTLHLRPYTLEIIDPSRQTRTNYEIRNGALQVKSSYQYDAGWLRVAAVHSAVQNEQPGLDTTSVTVYRSDVIDLNHTYGWENQGSAVYSGFTVINSQNGKSMTCRGQQLVMNEEVFSKLDLFEANSRLMVQPIYEKIESDVTIETADPKRGTIDGLNGSKLTGKVQYNDNIVGITAMFGTTPAASVSPSWSSSGMKVDNASQDPDIIQKVDVKVVDTEAKLTLQMEYPTVKIMANPNEYKYGVTDPVYTIDGVKYDTGNEAEKAKYLDYMDKLFVNGAPTADPEITLEFSYQFDPWYGMTDTPGYKNNDAAIKEAQEKFGDAVMAELRVYSPVEAAGGSVILKDSKKLNAEDKFRISGKLSELKWGSDDFATVVIHGSKGETTQELPITFLENTGMAVSLSDPKTTDEHGQTQDGKTTSGGLNTVASSNAANPTQTYNVQAYPPPGFVTVWGESSRDLDNDGDISQEEIQYVADRMKRLGFDDTKMNFNDKEIYYGNFFAVTPRYMNPTKVFYNIERHEGAPETNLTITLKTTSSTVLDPNDKETKEVRDAVVSVMGNQLEYNNEKKAYYDKDKYIWRRNYIARVDLAGYTYSSVVASGQPVPVTLETSEVMRPTSFRVTQAGTDLKLDATNRDIPLRSCDTTFTYEFNYSAQGVVPTDSEIIFYDKNGNERTRVSTGAPKARTTNIKGNDITVYEYSYTADIFNGLQLQAGDTMSIRGIYATDDTRVVYPEVPTGAVIHETLNAFQVLASFDTPVQPVLKLIGSVGVNYDLGYKVLDLKDQYTSKTFTDSNGVQRELKVFNFGLVNASKSSSVDLTKLADDAEKSAQKQSEAAKTNQPASREMLGQFQEALNQKEDTAKAKETLKKNTEDSRDGNAKKRTTGKGSVSLGFDLSLAIILEDGRETDKVTLADGTVIHQVNKKHSGVDVFNSLVLTAKATVGANAEVSYVTPIGIPITVGVSATADAMMAMSISSHLNDPMNEMYQLTGEGTISLDPANYDYGVKFVITPSLTVTAGVGWKYLKLEVSGTAAMDMFFDLPIAGDRKASGAGTVQFSAALKLRVLFIQKKWTLYQSDKINMFEFHQKTVRALSDPYNDFRYAQVETPSEENILARDYALSPFNTAPSNKLSRAVYYPLGENELQYGAYPFPELKAVDLGGEQRLVLYITDDKTRDEYNRSMLVYTVRKADGTYTDPKAVDNDGTLDESPNAFTVGDKVLITWSDAARKFTAEDTEETMLPAMDITGAWFDPATGTISQVFPITQTTEKDRFGDKDPHIAVMGDRLIVAYTKTDYTKPKAKPATIELSDAPANGEVLVNTNDIDGTNKTLYGDLINSYSTIAYRIATIGADGSLTWLETDNDVLGDHQRCLPAMITVEIDEREEKDQSAPLGRTTIQEVKKREKPITDPRILDTALTASGDQVLMAYVVDMDENLETGDQVLCLQMGDLKTEKFSNPIPISSVRGFQSCPKFVTVGDQLFLYWLSAGDLRYVDMSYILKSGLTSAEVDGQTIRYLNKAGLPIAAYEQVAVKGGSGTTIPSFDVETNGDWVVAVWSQAMTKPKDQDPDNSAPENLTQSIQLFVSACKPQTAKEAAVNWSMPVRLTPDDLVSYGYPTFLLLNDQVLDMYYVKYTRQLGEDQVFHENENDRILTASRIAVLTEVSASPLALATRPTRVDGKETNDVAYAPIRSGRTATLATTLTNTGMHPAKGWKCLWKVEYGGEVLASGEKNVSKHGLGYLPGGDSLEMLFSFGVPADLEKTGTVRVVLVDDKGMELQELAFPFGPEETFRIVGTGDFDANDNVELDMVFTNTGNKPYNGPYTVTMGGQEVAQGWLKLGDGESVRDKTSFHRDGLPFQPATADEKGGMISDLPITVKAGKTSYTLQLRKTADKAMVDAAKNVLGDTVKLNGVAVGDQDGAFISDTTLSRIEVTHTYAQEPSATTVGDVKTTYRSSDPSVAAVTADGTIVPVESGTATITVTTQPIRHEQVAHLDGSWEEKNVDFRTPDELKRSQSFTVTVGDNSDSSDDSDDDDTPSSTGGGSSSSGSSSSGSSSSAGVSKTETTKNPDGSTTKTTTDAKTGAVTETTKWPDGTNATVKTDASGKAEAQVELSKKTVETGEAVKLPISALPVTADKDKAAQVTVKTGSDKPISVEVPVKGVTPGTVAILVQPDGTEKVLRTSTPTEKGVVISLADGATVKIVDNAKSFTDVTSKDWFAPSVSFVSGHELFSGTGDGAFSPAVTMDRAMVATILHRMGDEPDAAKATFPDVTDTAYYAKAVAWAAEKGIVTGYDNGSFAPNDPITREQLAVMLYRYAKLSGEGFTGDWMFRMDFTDLDQISDWAYEALCWMTMKGVLQGKDGGRIDPKGQATRAEAAAMLQRFICR